MLFFRLFLLFVSLLLSTVYIFVLGWGGKPFLIGVSICIVLVYAGFYAPLLYVNNRATKRKQSIQVDWPDALDLLMICVEFSLRKVSDEIGAQFVDLAYEFALTNAELSYLTERR